MNILDDLLLFLENSDLKKNNRKEVESNQSIDNFKDLDILFVVKKEETFKGFDVAKLESIMRLKVIEENKNKQDYDRPNISVTELLGCVRKVYYERKKYPVDIYNQYIYPYLPLINHVGNAVHQFIQTIYGFDEVEKTVISSKYKVKGKVDGIKGQYVIEIKTFDQDKFNGKYTQDHFDQGNIYSYLLNSELNYNILGFTLVYVIRNLKKIYVFDLEIDNDRAISFLNRSLIIHDSLLKNIVPDTIGCDEEQCKYCIYKSICKKEIKIIESIPIRAKGSFSS